MWAPDGTRPRLHQHVVESDLDSLRLEELDDARGPTAAHLAQLGETALEHGGVAEVKPEQMRLAGTLDRTELDAVDDADTELLPGGARFGEAGDRIVIRRSSPAARASARPATVS
jgi:hypothetical protein